MPYHVTTALRRITATGICCCSMVETAHCKFSSKMSASRTAWGNAQGVQQIWSFLPHDQMLGASLPHNHAN